MPQICLRLTLSGVQKMVKPHLQFKPFPSPKSIQTASKIHATSGSSLLELATVITLLPYALKIGEPWRRAQPMQTWICHRGTTSLLYLISLKVKALVLKFEKFALLCQVTLIFLFSDSDSNSPWTQAQPLTQFHKSKDRSTKGSSNPKATADVQTPAVSKDLPTSGDSSPLWTKKPFDSVPSSQSTKVGKAGFYVIDHFNISLIDI